MSAVTLIARARAHRRILHPAPLFESLEGGLAVAAAPWNFKCVLQSKNSLQMRFFQRDAHQRRFHRSSISSISIIGKRLRGWGWVWGVIRLDIVQDGTASKQVLRVTVNQDKSSLFREHPSIHKDTRTRIIIIVVKRRLISD